MEIVAEKVIIYSLVIFFCFGVVWFYLRKQKRDSQVVEKKIAKAKLEGLYEPVSLHPVVDVNSCIKTGACVAACPEKDVLGIRNGKATTINASVCIGHGACFHACPTQAITLCIGTEKRGVDLPHVNQNFETNVPGIFIAGELGGMGLIKNAVEQGKQAVDNIVKSFKKNHQATFDLVIIGAGPAGIAASLTAKKHKLNFLKVADLAVIPGALALTFTRLANFVNRELVGRDIENPSFEWMGVDFGDGLLRYPSQIFQSISAFVLFLILLLLFFKTKKRGLVFFSYLFLIHYQTPIVNNLKPCQVLRVITCQACCQFLSSSFSCQQDYLQNRQTSHY